MFAITIRSGLAAGLVIGSILFGTTTLFHRSIPDPATGMAIGYAGMLLGFAMILIGVKRHRDIALGGVIGFAPALAMGLGITLIAGLFYVVAWEAALAVTGIDVSTEYATMMIADAEKSGRCRDARYRPGRRRHLCGALRATAATHGNHGDRGLAGRGIRVASCRFRVEPTPDFTQSQGMTTARTSSFIRIGVLGAGGRMGQAIIAGIAADPRLVLAGAIERAGHASVGRTLGSPFSPAMTIGSNPEALAHACDVLVDFTTPAALEATLDAACDGKAAIVIGTTGLEPRHHAMIDRAARSIAVLQAANTSLGVALLVRLVGDAARTLGPDWDIEIAELHHRDKIDSPSGTALALGAAAAAGRGVELAAVSDRGRDGTTGARVTGHIGFAALRGGSAAGDHNVLFAGDGERIELRHLAENRDIFVRGALRAAAWLAGRPPGRYAMDDVLALPLR